MSFRTILVGILAAICGVTATIGVNLLSARTGKTTATSKIVVARVNIGYGVQLTDEMVSMQDWPASLLPPGSITKIEDAVGQYSVASMIKDEPIFQSKLSSQTTNLHIPDGMRGVAIETKEESSSVGRLIVPGNRVDVILTITRHELLNGPETFTLLENVEVLAVGQRFEPNKASVDSDNHKSVTLLVTPEMAENINLGAELGKLHLSLRSPNDPLGVEPRTKKNLRQLFQELAEAERVASLPPVKEKEEINKTAALKIPNGMRAITIQTPDESAGVAGLVLPEDRVDILLTLDTRIRDSIKDREDSKQLVVTYTLLENVEVLAVDTKMNEAEGSSDPKMSRSVTLLVTPEMAQDISNAQMAGTLALTLRGTDDLTTGGPRRIVDLAELLTRAPANVEPQLNLVPDTGAPEDRYQIIRVNRGGLSQDLRFFTPD